MSPLENVATRSDLVAASLRSAILSGRLGPGEVLVERRVADMLGVSKTPVREALIALTSSGLLTPTSNRGVAVRRLRVKDVLGIYEIRMLMEPWAAAGVVEAGMVDMAAAETALEDSSQAVEVDDHVGLSLANRRFHRSLYARCQNELAVRTLDDLQDLTALGTVSLLWEHWPTWRDEEVEHREIFEAAKAGGSTQVENLLRNHIGRSVARLTSGDQDMSAAVSPGRQSSRKPTQLDD